MKIDKSTLYNCWYEDEHGTRYPRREDIPTDVWKNQVLVYHSNIPNVIVDNMSIYKDSKHKCSIGSRIASWNEGLVMAMANSGDYTLSEAIKVVTRCCERCLNVLYCKYLSSDGTDFCEDWLYDNWDRHCEFCDKEDDQYILQLEG